MLYTLVLTILIVTLYLAHQASLNLGQIAVLYTLVFTNLIVTLSISTTTKVVIRPDCSALYTSASQI